MEGGIWSWFKSNIEVEIFSFVLECVLKIEKAGKLLTTALKGRTLAPSISLSTYLSLTTLSFSLVISSNKENCFKSTDVKQSQALENKLLFSMTSNSL